MVFWLWWVCSCATREGSTWGTETSVPGGTAGQHAADAAQFAGCRSFLRRILRFPVAADDGQPPASSSAFPAERPGTDAGVSGVGGVRVGVGQSGEGGWG